MGGDSDKDAPERTPISLLRQAVKDAWAKLEPLYVRTQLNDLGYIFSRVRVCLDYQAPG